MFKISKKISISGHRPAFSGTMSKTAVLFLFAFFALAAFLLMASPKAQSTVQNWYFHNGAGDGAGFWWYDYKNI